MDQLQITWIETEHYYSEHENDSAELVSKRISDLSQQELKELNSKVEAHIDYDKAEYIKALKDALIHLPRKEIVKALQPHGYVPKDSFREGEGLDIGKKFFYENSFRSLSEFDPSNPSDFDKTNIFKSNRHYVEIKFPKSHPFMKSKAKFLKEEGEKARKAEERKKEKEIEKAKKLLEEIGELK